MWKDAMLYIQMILYCEINNQTYCLEMKRPFALILICLLSHSVMAWGPNGHRIVAAICDHYLTDKAKTEIQQLIGKDYIEEIANWPDYVKSERGWDFASPWHYTTVHPDQSVEDVQERYLRDSTINDAMEAIILMTQILEGDARATNLLEDLMDKNRARPLHNSTKATALAFLVHLIGDIHQPLHVGKNRDLGGNKITVLFFSEKSNLHAVWDSKIIEHEKLSYTEFARFINTLSDEEAREVMKAGMVDWANESIELREDIYNNIYNYTDRESGLPSFSWQYQHDYINPVKDRLLKGGVRLAAQLNRIFG